MLQKPFVSRATRLFCDVYNPQSKTYCKRLQVLCPEHSRDPKVSEPHESQCQVEEVLVSDDLVLGGVTVPLERAAHLHPTQYHYY